MNENSTRKDLFLALGIGIVTLACLVIWPFEGLHPYHWTDAAVSCGALPQQTMLPGIGNGLMRLLFLVFPFSVALSLYTFLGHVAVAISAVLVYSVFAGMMRLVAGAGARDLARRRIATRVAAGLASLAFVCSAPVWDAAQGLSGPTVVMFLFVLSSYFYVRMLETASYGHSVACLLTTGLLAAESPLGWVVLVLGVVMMMIFLRHDRSEQWVDFLDPVRMQRTKWSMTFVFIGALFLGIFLEAVSFALMDGLKASGISAGDLPVAYIVGYWRAITESMTLTGFGLVLFVAVVPYVLTQLMISAATDEDRYLSFKFSILYFMTTLVSFRQLSPFEFAWFWSIAPGSVMSRDLLLFTSFLSALAFAWGFFVLGVEIFCRDYKHIESVIYQSYSERGGDDDEPVERRPARGAVVSVKLTFGRLSMLIVPLALAVVFVWGRELPNDRTLNSLIYEFIGETLNEATGSRYLFSDGAYDAAIRVEARRRGLGVTPVSLMSGKSHQETYIRQMDTSDFEDRMTLETGAAEALRTWVMSKSERLSEISVQLAFEIFRLNRRLDPIVYGALVRPAGGDRKAADESIARCHSLSEKIIDVHEKGVWRHAKDASLKDRFLFAQFRLAVMSRLRAINLDQQKKVKESIEEIAYSDRLNMNNPSLVKILKRMDWVRRQTGEALTPREGLDVALKRADFVMARRYAMPVLKEDADEPNANFAVGMSYYVEQQFAKAEEYLLRCLKRNPSDGAIYNNIALICLKTQRLKEAEEYAKKALELAPNVPEVKDTVQQVEKAKESAKTPLREGRK